MAGVFDDSDNIDGGTDGALQAGFTDSVAAVLSEDPSAAIVIEGDFVPGAVETTLTFPDGFSFFLFPSIAGSPPTVVTGGDSIVLLRDSEAGRVFAEYLSFAVIWVSRGGFSTLAKDVDPSSYPDPTFAETAAIPVVGGGRPFRHLGPPAGRLRWNDRTGNVEALPGSPGRSEQC